ncbi:type II secretion system F family protein [Smaragdicoccus niigatensis]|uniref:type II secretion system F family protein n=1 Tax=Smaragdicoccus niigatensis TaxID=359359 RepID=UPI00036827F8|nr:type II secretion system F family protein [Smaragdicoccus niigatensis]
MTMLLLAVATATWPSSLRRPTQSPRRRPFRARPEFLWALPPVVGWFVGGPSGLVAASIVLATAWILQRRLRQEREQAALRRELAQGVEALVGELRTGASQVDSCEAAAAESSGRVRQVLETASARCRLGGSCSDSLLSELWPSEDLRRIGAIWQVAERHGLSVGDLLEAARRDLAGRLRFDDSVRSSLAGPRATATVLSALPLFGLALGEVMGAHPVGVLLGGGVGGILLVVGCAFACVGRLWTHSIANGVRA